jgi:molybdopterin molybdotransferase
MQEDTRVQAHRLEEVQILDAAKPWENVRLRGVDVKRGEVICEAGELLTAGKLALLAATGVPTVAVGHQPRVALLATGSELLSPGDLLSAGKVFESNRTMLAALVDKAGGAVESLPIVRDSMEETRNALELAFARADFVVTSGGVSVGELDFVKSAFTQLGGELDLWQVAMRPGKPFVFGRLGKKLLFGLPGNPVSAFVTFLLLVRPAMCRWQGAGEVLLPRFRATLAESLSNQGDRRHFVRVKLDANGGVRATGLQQSHALKSLATATGLVDVPPGSTLPSGTLVQVLRWD